MSFLLVSGKIWHCDACGADLRVDYEGGAQFTQIGDEAVFEQMELAQRLGQPADDPEREGFYLHDAMVCPDCRAGLAPEESARADAALVLLGMLEATFESRDARFGEIAGGLADLSDNDWRELLGKPEFDELAGRSLLPAKKLRKLNAFFQNHRCLDKFLAARLARIGPGSELETRLGDTAAFAEAHGLAEPFEVLRPFESWQPENLNPYIRAEMTVRTPVATTPHVTLFRRGVVDYPALMHTLSCTSPDEILDSQDSARVIAEVKAQAERRFVGAA